jgi:hypothetical protein
MSDRLEITRREAMKRALLGGAGLALAPHLGSLAFAADTPGKAVAATAKAKAVIQIWMWGGPPHTDTFDPKPEAGREYCGPLDKAIETNVSGIRVGQMLPNLAKQADKYSIVRSMTHGVNGHETASYITQTGHTPGKRRIVYPSVGAVVSHFRGYEHGYKGEIPPYVVMTRPLGRFSEVGFLGLNKKPFVTGGDPNQARFAVEGIVAQGISDERQKSRRKLLHGLDTLGKAMPDDPRFTELDRCEDKAYEMILGDAGKVFDLTEEKKEMRDAYGRNKFGQSCLAARRLVESGVPFVAINYEGWDTHKKHFEAMNRKLPEMDRAMATLLEDLSARGLLDETIVWWGGEFGRTPKVQWGEPWNGGRSHFGACFSSVLAGGGFKGGLVVGESDAKGETVKDRPVHPRELIASIYDRLGIDPDGKMPNPRGLDVNVLPPPKDGEKSGNRLTEIMAS